ncbi:hypothetical protein KJ673_04025 [Patescibacteria group bacterium]|nr:hypothetical protein [Patescibacteria group bacterium]MBU4453211.1 hypothetical protein [Patescibacteria group bacterium]MCG2687730.1 hypothetical protein [Candidatus Parcubacteria bacterium]
MERKQKIEISVAVVIIIALVCILAWILYPNKDSVVPGAQDSEQVVIDGEVVPSLDYSAYPQSASTIARVFVERFGSFSNQNSYENVQSVMDIASSSLKQRLTKIINDATLEDDSVYYGVSTHILSVDQVSATDSLEKIEVLTQREESIESPANTTVRYQTMAVTLVKEGDSWLVDDFVWE